MDEAAEPQNKAHLFTLRIWSANEEETAPQWRSRLQNLQSGEVNFCRDWDTLVATIEKALHEQNQESDSKLIRQRREK